MYELKTKCSLDSQAIGVLGTFIESYQNGCLYNQALADVWSTGAGIKCLNFMFTDIV